MPLHAEVVDSVESDRDEAEIVLYDDGVRVAKLIFTRPEGDELQGWLITSEDSPIEWSTFADRRRSERTAATEASADGRQRSPAAP